MFNRYILSLILLGLLLVFSVSFGRAYELSGSYTTLSSENRDFSYFEGTFLVLEVIQPICGFCMDNTHRNAMAINYWLFNQSASFMTLSLSTDIGQMVEFVETHNITWYSGLKPDEAVKNQLQLTATPTIILLNSQGEVEERIIGAVTNTTLFNVLNSFLDPREVNSSISSITNSSSVSVDTNPDWYDIPVRVFPCLVGLMIYPLYRNRLK